MCGGVAGSSPLARGTPTNAVTGNGLTGLIPARAGNTRSKTSRREPLGAHPRSRGEHAFNNRSKSPSSGSSPLARGTLKRTHIATAAVGLIPARAGNTRLFLSLPRNPRAHPRSRGEHRRRKVAAASSSGSSPLARGTRIPRRRLVRRQGLIPARAGNTAQFARKGTTRGAHPRSRGEHPSAGGRVLQVKGSSPLARGTPGSTAGGQPAGGLIPARAGNTRRIPHSISRSRAHPRSRGEHVAPASALTHRGGSSPLARGTRIVPLLHPGRNGLIPARAGNTRARNFS